MFALVILTNPHFTIGLHNSKCGRKKSTTLRVTKLRQLYLISTAAETVKLNTSGKALPTVVIITVYTRVVPAKAEIGQGTPLNFHRKALISMKLSSAPAKAQEARLNTHCGHTAKNIMNIMTTITAKVY